MQQCSSCWGPTGPEVHLDAFWGSEVVQLVCMLLSMLTNSLCGGSRHVGFCLVQRLAVTALHCAGFTRSSDVLRAICTVLLSLGKDDACHVRCHNIMCCYGHVESVQQGCCLQLCAAFGPLLATSGSALPHHYLPKRLCGAMSFLARWSFGAPVCRLPRRTCWRCSSLLHCPAFVACCIVLHS
jgi:hypothetical protein